MNDEQKTLAHKVAFFRAEANLNAIRDDIGQINNVTYERLYWESRQDTDKMSLADLRDELNGWRS
jgi:hypothetical protein